MAVSPTSLTPKRKYATGTTSITVTVITVTGWHRVRVRASGDAAHVAVVGADATLAALSTGDSAPSGYDTAGIAAGGAEVFDGPHIGPWSFVVWGDSGSTVIDVEAY